MDNAIHTLNTEFARAIADIFENMDVMLHGLAEPVLVRDTEREITLPAIVFPNGECLGVYDECDKHALTLYHRLQSVSYSESQSAYGSRRDYAQTVDVSLLVFGRREINQYQLENALCRVISRDNKRLLVGTDFNAVQVFASEYSGLPYFLSPDYFLFRINYRITSTFGCNKNS